MNINAPVFTPRKSVKNQPSDLISAPISGTNIKTAQVKLPKNAGIKMSHDFSGMHIADKTYKDRKAPNVNPFRVPPGKNTLDDAAFDPSYDEKKLAFKPLHNTNTISTNNPFRGKPIKDEGCLSPIAKNMKENKFRGEEPNFKKPPVKSNSKEFVGKTGGFKNNADFHPHAADSQKGGKYSAAEFPAKPYNNANPFTGNPRTVQPVSPKPYGGAAQKPNAYNEKRKSKLEEPRQSKPENLHALQNYWSLWHLDASDTGKTWEALLSEITTIGTVEEFWNVYNHIKPPSELSLGNDYCFFKRGIRPMWEDPANINGGRWVITLNKSASTVLDKLWLNVLLCIIGEVFDNAHEVCGVVVSIRFKCNKVAIWTTDGMNEEAVFEIGTKLQNGLHLGYQNMQYQLHKDTMLKMSSNVMPIYVL